MSKSSIEEMEITRVVIFIELEDGTIRQVITKPGLKKMAINFIAEQSGGSLPLGDKEEIHYLITPGFAHYGPELYSEEEFKKNYNENRR